MSDLLGFDVQSWLNQLGIGNQGGQAAQTGGVNRFGPSTPPRIQMPQNQQAYAPGSFMNQAMQLSGVPMPLPMNGTNLPNNVPDNPPPFPGNGTTIPSNTPANPPPFPGNGTIVDPAQWAQALQGYGISATYLPGILQALQGFR